MRHLAVYAVVLLMVLTAGCGEISIARRAEDGIVRKYNVVKLEELVKHPEMFTSVPIKFTCLMGDVGNVFVAMNTHFGGTDNINFGVWPADAALWIDEQAADKYHPLLYISKSSPSFPIFRDLSKYEVIEIYGIVRDTYMNQAWIEVKAIQRVMNETTGQYMAHFTPESLFYIKNAMEYEKEKELDFAIEDYRQALKRNLPVVAHAEILAKVGNLLFQKESYEEARTVLEECVALGENSGNYVAFALLGEVYRQLEDYDRAVLNSEKALNIKPNYYPALRTFGISLARRLQNPDYIEAERKCLRALRFDPTDPTTNWYLGQIYGLQTRYNESIDYFKKAIDYYPQNHKYHKGLAGIYHLRSNLADIKPEQAVQDKRIAIHEYDIVKTILSRTDFQDPDVYYFTGVIKEEIALIMQQSGQDKEAEKLLAEATVSYEECVKVDAEYKLCWDALANRYAKYERFADAIAVYDNLNRLEPDNADHLLKKAGIQYSYIKDKPAAVETLKQGLKIDANNYEAIYLVGRYLLEYGWDQKKTEAKDIDKVFKEALSFLDRANRITRDEDIKVQRDLVLVNWELGDWKRCAASFEIFDRILKGQEQPTVTAEEIIAVHNAAGDAYLKLGKDARAMELYETSLSIDKKQAAANMKLAIYNLRSKKTAPQALEYAKEAAVLSPSIDTLDLLGWALSENDKHEDALKVYDKLEKAPEFEKNISAKFHCGMVAYRMKDMAKAKMLLSDKRILDSDDFGRDARNTLKEISRGR